MTNAHITQTAPILVAIDIAKYRHEVLIDIPDRKRRRRLSVLNMREEFERLIVLLLEYDRPVRVAFEATGNYHRAIAYYLSTAGFEMKLISSVALARTREALHNSWDKNDPKDAQVILHMMTIGTEQIYHDPLTHDLNDIQELSKTHDIVSKSKTELWHRFENPPVWGDLLTVLSNILLVFFALALTVRDKDHIALDLIYSLLPLKFSFFIQQFWSLVIFGLGRVMTIYGIEAVSTMGGKYWRCDILPGRTVNSSSNRTTCPKNMPLQLFRPQAFLSVSRLSHRSSKIACV